MSRSVNRLAYVDFFRAYAIFLVSGFHLWRFFGRPSSDFYNYDFFLAFSRGSWGVELFFVISGYCMSMITYKGIDSYQIMDWKQYILKRILRIIPAYYIAIFIWSVLIYFGVAPKPIGLIDQISHILFIHTFNPNTYYSISGVFWSLGIEMQFYFILPFVIYFLIRWWPIAIIISLIPIVIFNKGGGFTLDKTVFSFIAYFFIGYVLYFKENIIYKYLFALNKKMGHVFLAIFIAIFLHLTFHVDTVVSRKFHCLLWVLTFIPIFIYTSKNTFINDSKNIFLRFFIFTGTASYSIYLYNYIFYIHTKPYGYGVSPLIFYFLMIYLTGISMYYLIEKPAQRFRRWFLKRQS